MVRVEFSNMGYTCFDENNHFVYSEDATHEFLFEYLTKDWSNITTLFDEYFSKRLDITNWELKNFHAEDEDKRDFLKIQKEMESIHPFYKYNGNYVISTEIAEYFNQLLCYCNHTIDENDYAHIITNLLPSEVIHLPSDFYDANYQDYCKRVGKSIDENQETLIAVYEPTWLSNERSTQTIISDMLYYILDITTQEGLEKLSIPQRAFLYESVNYFNLNSFSVKAKASFVPLTLTDGSNQTENPHFSFGKLCYLNWTDVKNNGLPSDKKELFESALAYVSSQKNTTSFLQYEIDDLFQLLYLEIVSMVNANIMVRKCKNCGKYFVVSNRKIAYCDRIYESGKRCSSIGSTRSFQQKLKQEEALKIYTRAYKTHHARVKKEKMSQNDFTTWCDEAKAKLEQVRSGKLNITDFQNWLKI